MATESTVEFGSAHPPKEESINVFKEVLPKLKHDLVQLRHDHDKHEPEYFAAVRDLSDQDLAGFAETDFVEVRVGRSAYGIHLFGKVRIPALPDSGPAYFHFRAFTDGPEGEPAKLHSIHTEEKVLDNGDKTFRAIFTKKDPLEWFDS